MGSHRQSVTLLLRLETVPCNLLDIWCKRRLSAGTLSKVLGGGNSALVIVFLFPILWLQTHYFGSHLGASKIALTKARLLKHYMSVHRSMYAKMHPCATKKHLIISLTCLAGATQHSWNMCQVHCLTWLLLDSCEAIVRKQVPDSKEKYSTPRKTCNK